MNIAQTLAHTAEVFEPKTFDALREQLDAEWIEEALAATGTVSVRRRRLPAEEMIWLVIGMALLRDRTITDVARSLSLDGPGPKTLVSSSAVSQARQRLGQEPLRWLFACSAKVFAHRSADHDRFNGLALYGVDGTNLRVPDTPSNAERFGYAKSVRGESAYPLVRLVVLMALRSHVIAAAAFGAYNPGFKPQRVLTSLTDHRRYLAAQVAALYHERWELELGYDEIKTELLDRRESIRSQRPDGVEQEIWGLLLAYNLVRTYMERVAVIAKLPPLRISFINALRFIREEWYFDLLPGFAPGSLPRHMRRLAEQMSRFILPERRSSRSAPRAVKIKMSNYPRKRRPA